MTSISDPYEAAKTFLSALDPVHPQHTFQTVGRGATRSRVFHGTLEALWPRLQAENRLGADCYVCVNRTDLKGRKRENIVAIRAVFVECDDLSRLPEKLPIDPSIVVETSPGHRHLYWLTDCDDLDRWPGVMARLVQDYGSDPNAKDISRVLRLPGLAHRGEGKQAFEARLVECHPERRYAWAQIERAFPPLSLPTTPATEHLEVETPTEEEEERLVEALSCLPADERKVWLDVGFALKTLPGDRGRLLFDAWSETSGDKVDLDEDINTWETLNPTRTHWRHIFTLARKQEGSTFEAATPDDFDRLDEPTEPTEPVPSGVAARLTGEGADYRWAPVTKQYDGSILYADPRRDALDVERILRGEIEQPRWLVDRWIPIEVSVLGGPPGVSKSTLMLWQVLHILLGRPLYGHEVVGGPHRVLIVSHEDHGRLYEYRLYHLMEAMGLSHSERRSALSRLYLIDASAVYLPWLKRDRGGNLDTTEWPHELAKRYKHWGISYVVIDPLSNLGLDNENSNSTLSLLVQASRIIKQELDCAVELIHHISQTAARDTGPVDMFFLRGATSLPAGMRTVRLLLPHLREHPLYLPPPEVPQEAITQGNVLRLHTSKINWAKTPPEPTWLVRQDFSFTWALGYAPGAQALADAQEAQREARRLEQLTVLLEALAEAAAGGVHRTLTEWSRDSRLSSRLRLPVRDMQTLLQEAMRAGHVTEEPDPEQRKGRRRLILKPRIQRASGPDEDRRLKLNGHSPSPSNTSGSATLESGSPSKTEPDRQ